MSHTSALHAERLIADVAGRDADRALRISGLYALVFLESSFAGSWCGLASFVALHVHRVLSGPSLGFGDAIAEGNVNIYRAIMPAWLDRRVGRPVEGPLAPSFAALARAEALLASDPVGADVGAERALEEMCVIEQRVVTQPVFESMSTWRRRRLRGAFLFRLGLDTAAPIVRFPGDDPTSLEQRLAWTRHGVLPAWERARVERLEWIRADLDRIRRKAGLNGDALDR